MGTMRIDIVGKAAVDENVSRNDGAPGDVVRVVLYGTPGEDDFAVVWTPSAGVGEDAEMTTVGESTAYQFTIPPGAVGTYRFRYANAGTTDYRELAVLTPNRGLRIPALGSKASPDAALTSIDSSSSDNNAFYDDPRIGQGGGPNYTGYALDIEKLILEVDGIAPSAPASADLGLYQGHSTSNVASPVQGAWTDLASLTTVVDVVQLDVTRSGGVFTLVKAGYYRIAFSLNMHVQSANAGVRVRAGTTTLLQRVVNELTTNGAAYTLDGIVQVTANAQLRFEAFGLGNGAWGATATPGGESTRTMSLSIQYLGNQ